MRVVLDASALLAYLRAEPGSEAVDGVLGSALITSVNWAEVLQKSLSVCVEVEGLRQELQVLGLAVEPFSAGDAATAALLWPQTRNLGLLLAGSCLPEPGVAPQPAAADSATALRGCRSGVQKWRRLRRQGGIAANQQPTANSP